MPDRRLHRSRFSSRLVPERAPPRTAQKPLGDVPLMHEEAAAAGLDSVYDGPWEFFVGGGGAALDCDGSGFPSVFLAGGKNPAQALRQQIQARRAAQVRGEAARHRRRSEAARQCHRRLSDRHRRRRPHGPVRAAGRRAICCSRAARTARSRSPTRNGVSTAIRAGPPRSPPNGSRGRNSRRSPSAITSIATRRARPGAPAQDNSLYRPQPGDKPDYSVRTPLAPGFCALSMLFTDWNHSGTPSLRVSNDRQYYRGGEEQMWRIEPGKTPRLYCARRRLAACVDLRHGHRRGRSSTARATRNTR